MARDPRELERLARELAALSDDERDRVLARVGSRARLRPPPSDFEPPALDGGTSWIGGSLKREELYNDDGR